MGESLLEFMAVRAAGRSGSKAGLPATLLSEMSVWGGTDGWWNREWARAAEAAEALAIDIEALRAMVEAKRLVGYDFEGALHIPSRDLAVAVWEKAQGSAE